MKKIKSFKLFESHIPTEDEVRYSLIDLYDLEYNININYYDVNYLKKFTGINNRLHDVDQTYQIEIYKDPNFKVSDIIKDCIITTIDFFKSKYDGFSYNLLYFKIAPGENDHLHYVNIEGDLDIFFENNDIITNNIMLYLNF